MDSLKDGVLLCEWVVVIAVDVLTFNIIASDTLQIGISLFFSFFTDLLMLYSQALLGRLTTPVKTGTR